MPRGDRTGPWGQGPRTGRQAGYCSGYGAPGFANPAFGYGFGRGRGGGRGFFGRGRGFRNQFYASGQPGRMRYGGFGPGYAPGYDAPVQDFSKEALQEQAQALESELEFIKQRLQELENKSEG